MTDNIATGLLTINRVSFGIRSKFTKILVKFTPEIFGNDKRVSLEGDDVCFPVKLAVKSASCSVSSQIATITLP